MNEYRNVEKIQHNKWSPISYDAELWTDNKFIMRVTLSEVDYKKNVLMNKLELMQKLALLLNDGVIKEIEEVMQLMYEEGSLHGYEDGQNQCDDGYDI